MKQIGWVIIFSVIMFSMFCFRKFVRFRDFEIRLFSRSFMLIISWICIDCIGMEVNWQIFENCFWIEDLSFKFWVFFIKEFSGIKRCLIIIYGRIYFIGSIIYEIKFFYCFQVNWIVGILGEFEFSRCFCYIKCMIFFSFKIIFYYKNGFWVIFFI